MTSQTRARGQMRGALGALRPQRAGVVYALILIVVIFEILTNARALPSFLQISNVRNVLDGAALDGILVVSMTVLLITGNFDLSVGATAGLAAAAALKIANADGVALGTLAAIGVGLGTGLANGVLVQVVGVNAFIVTLGSYTALQGLMLIITNSNTILANSTPWGSIGTGTWTVPQIVMVLIGVAFLAYTVVRVRRARASGGGGFVDGSTVGATIVGLLVIIVAVAVPGLVKENRDTWIMLAYMSVAALVLRFTVLGRRVYAVGGNTEAARLSGIHVGAYKIGAFVLTSLSASVVGLIYAGKFGAVEPTALVNEELPVLAAAILGGTSLFGGSGYVTKGVVGTLILASLTVGFNILNIGSSFQYLVQGVVIIAAAAVYTVASRNRRRAQNTFPDAGEPTSQEPEAVTAMPAAQANDAAPLTRR